MLSREFVEKLFARAKEAGFSDCEAYFSCGNEFSCGVFDGEVVDYSSADTFGLGFRGLIDGRMGYASTQVLDTDAIELLVLGAKENAQLIESEDTQFLFAGADAYPVLPGCSREISAIPAPEKIRMAREMEAHAKQADPRIRQVGDCMLFSSEGTCAIVNTRGLDVSYSANGLGGYVTAVAGEDDRVNTGSAYFFTADPGKIDPDGIVSRAVEEAISGLDAGSVPSGEMRVLFQNDCFASLLATFSGVFSAERAQRGLSLLAGREGEQIAAQAVTVVDNPLLEDTASSMPFDGEGVPTFKKCVIEQGRLTTLLHNLKTANKQGIQTTANASRAGYAAVVGVAPSNFYVAPAGDCPLDRMLARLGDGLFVTELQGMHAGADPVSGDFSLGAKGFLVEGGRRVKPVRNITVAGNFFALLQAVEAVGSDLCFQLPGASTFGSPSVLVRSLSVAGTDAAAEA